MKRVLRIFGVFLVAILLSGCMNVRMVMKVNDDKSFDINMQMELDLVKYMKTTLSFDPNSQNLTEEELKKRIDEELQKGNFNLDNFMDEEEQKEIEKQGFKVEENLDKENYIYKISLTKHCDNIDEASETEEEAKKENTKDETFPSQLFIKTANNTYKFNLDLNEENSSGTDSDNNYMNGLTNIMSESINYKYEITLPNKPISHNATSIYDDGKTLIWDLKANDKNKVEFEFAFPEPKEAPMPSAKAESTNIMDLFKDMSNEKIIALSLIAGGTLTVIIATIIFVISNKKNK